MKRTVSLAFLLLVLCATNGESSAQIICNDLFREAVALVSEQQAPFSEVIEVDSSVEFGAFETHLSVFWEDGHCNANHTTDVVADGQTLDVSGFLQGDMARSAPGETNRFKSSHIILAEFESNGAFEIHGDLELAGTNGYTLIVVLDLATQEPVYFSGTNPPSGSFHAICAGTGPFQLQIAHLVEAYLDEPGGVEASVDFEVIVAPEGTIAVTNETWSGVKALFR